ncbi:MULTISPECIES: GTP cyclohydrolase II [unclassified Minwuia]|uniref:GTP cyclohydrolase II n=1 Tax=unclassified Minwuia TaxID=2618799 RepID=UPI00247904A3|nr:MULTISPECIES: GTP cyclohydrolase II [unclassified Minwuia]
MARQSEDETSDLRHVRQVDRAAADLRRGMPVIVRGAAQSGIIVSAETATAEEYGELLAMAEGGVSLALTARRANVLHILPSGHDVQLVPIDATLSRQLASELADPAHDLDGGMRGPFRQVKDAPPDWASAGVGLARHARLLPAVLVAALSDTADWQAAGLAAVDAGSIAAIATHTGNILKPVAAARLPLWGAENTRMHAYRPADGGLEHLALVTGDPPRDRPVLTRIHSECFTGDLLGSMKCDCGEQLRGAIEAIGEAGEGILLYLAQEGRGIGLMNKIRAYALQDRGFDTVDANQRIGFETDERLFRPAAEMLRRLGYSSVRLMTNNPEKVSGLEAEGISVAERVPHKFPSNPHNADYLATKKSRTGHFL